MTNIRRTQKRLVRMLFILLATYTAVTLLQRFDFKPEIPVPSFRITQADY